MTDKVKSKWGPHKKLVIAAINSFGKGQHPKANDNNIDFFTTSYVHEILHKAKEHIHPDHKESLENAINHTKDMMKPKKSTTVKEAIDASIMKQTALMKEKFEAALFEKAAEQLAEKKIQVAEKYFR